ncbi:hypothetical protein CBS101457_000401 [Exobasidium rhododendri]|nr:hypothetical protein CBS101457_000401 [Exobasidium rhododendri]
MASNYMRKVVPRKADGRIDFAPKKHHGWTGVIFILGFFLPPLAVAARFGIGKDFAINVVCTICGYFPGHGHNFFIQNIRNNDNKNRTPKWAKRYGLVDDSADKRKERKRAWVGRYNDQAPERRMYDDDGNAFTYDHEHRFEDGDGPRKPQEAKSNRVDGLEENYYNQDRGGNGDRSSLNRTRSSRSLRSTYSGGGEPGAGDAELRKAKSKSKRGFLGTKKSSKADRHARSEQVMGMGDESEYAPRTNYNHSMDDSPGSSSRRDSLADGPEDADATVGQRYTGRNRRDHDPLDSKILPLKPAYAPPPVRDVMLENHQF